MIFSKILNPKYTLLFRVISVVILSVFSFTFYSCFTYKTEYYSPEELRTKNNYTIEVIKLKNDSIINIISNKAEYIWNKDSTKDAILCTKIDTIELKSAPERQYKIKQSLSEIKLIEIMNAKVEIKKLNLVNTIIAASSVGLIIASIIYIIHEFNLYKK